MKLLTDPIMWTYIVLVSVSVCKVLEKEDVEKAKMRFITLTFLLGVCESLRENNLAILVAIVMAICLYTCWVKRQERIKKLENIPDMIKELLEWDKKNLQVLNDAIEKNKMEE